MTAMSPLERIADQPLGTAYRNLPASDLTVGTIAKAGWRVTDLVLPAITLRRSALDNNAALFAGWASDHGLSHAPHGKTSMAPQLFHQQLAAGAWAITAATAHQARFMQEYGVPRVVLANEVVDPAGLRVLAETLADNPDFELFVLVDSEAAADRMAEVLATTGLRRPVSVLLEVGVTGGRAGVRTHEKGLAVAARVAELPQLELAGVECFEGVIPQERTETSLGRVDEFLDRLSALIGALDERGAFSHRDEVILTAGGSAFPDRVAAVTERLPQLTLPIRTVVRSGGYITHDHAMYETVSPFAATVTPEGEHLLPALELWAVVQSTPEPGLAICGFGKRDAPFDAGLPVPLTRRGGDGVDEPLSGVSVLRLNDQHAFLDHHGELAVGDVVRFGLSHPCTAFDKWPLLPVLDDDDQVVEAVRTFF